MPIAVDVSGDGKLQPAASVPGSGLSTRYDALEIYLVSAKTNINMTVSATPDFLTGESGSTVKHLNFPIPTCIPSGDYNVRFPVVPRTFLNAAVQLTFYETSHFNSLFVFTITPIPVPISNTSPSGQCNASVLNALQSQPQADNPLTQSPFAPNSSVPVSTSSSAAGIIVPFRGTFMLFLGFSFFGLWA